MKKLLLIISTSFLLINCSSDDSGDNLTAEQKIEGKWKNVSEKIDGVTVELSECEKLDTFLFSAGLGQFSAEIHNENDQQNGCDSELILGTYEVVNGKYVITAQGETVILQDVTFGSDVMTTTQMDGSVKIVTNWIKIN